ncbi:hypothetical protein [Colwellia sp. E2M01]|uniref:hypothetical protein n=1 Tax=Colwellia sp. E2M01 TaxID=2841561 RepID=UPI001C08FE5F|nr:hypothetical protein [Colwellia sp. E2M01]MBU2871914.1 hypothetical protein [Colwellia sp. E2M01]
MQTHGSFIIFNQDNTLVVKPIGAWNYETAVMCGLEYKQLVGEFKGKPWACLLDLTEWEFFTPDAAAYIDELNAWGNINNQKYEVVISKSALQIALLEKSHKVLTNVETKFCDNIEDAYQWLEELGVINVSIT